jgi:hypothetical protein
MYLIKKQNKIANNANMELKNANANGDNVVGSNQTNTNFFF